MKNSLIFSLSAVSLFVIVMLLRPANGGWLENPRPLPAFTGQAADWINSEPLTVEQLRGKVLLLDFWTFDCWNCYRSFPWLRDLEQRLATEGLQVIGIHTPEFEHEKKRDNVVAKIEEFSLPHPVMMDNNFTYWKALKNRFWPTFYLVDKQGQIRASFIGETHKGDANARQIEAAVKQLLEE